MTNEDRLDAIQEFMEWEYYSPVGSWADVMIAWNNLTQQVWRQSGQSYPPWFQKYIESWKTNCFSADLKEALITLTDAIKEFQATHVTT